jgi:Holliday junction resolvasome RuvABC endonuclease subunit
MTFARVVGLDTSLTSTGLARLALTPEGELAGSVALIHPASKLKGRERMEWMRLQIVQECNIPVTRADANERVLVVMEKAIPQRQAFALENIGLWWLVKHTIEASPRFTVVQVYATTAKKYLTGNGGAGKDEVLLNVERRYRHIAEVNGNDQADALGFAVMGADRLGWPVPKVTKIQAASLEKMEWFDGPSDN